MKEKRNMHVTEAKKDENNAVTAVRMPWYIYEHRAYTKERWVGCKLLDVLSNEFKRRSSLYFQKAIEAGSIHVNAQSVDISYILKHGDLITHTTHRHEPPIPTDKIDIIYENNDILVVDKPSGIPCHPNSSYNKNSLTEILKQRMGLNFISAQNRLDKQTSGVVILAKNSEAAVEYHKKMAEREGIKIYLCKVRGEFPEHEIIVDLPLAISRKTCTTTIHQIDGVFQGKKSTTIFRRIPQNTAAGESILACGLVTGRTHQIRVHLQAIGFPIVDDMVYSQPYIESDLINDLLKIQDNEIVVEKDQNEEKHTLDINKKLDISHDKTTEEDSIRSSPIPEKIKRRIVVQENKTSEIIEEKEENCHITTEKTQKNERTGAGNCKSPDVIVKKEENNLHTEVNEFENIPAQEVDKDLSKDLEDKIDSNYRLINSKSIHITEEVYLKIAESCGLSLTNESVSEFVAAEDCRTDEFQDDKEYLQGVSTNCPSEFIAESCMHCRKSEDLLSSLPKFSTLSLHAWKYYLKDNSFTTELPSWCPEEIDSSVWEGIEATKSKLCHYI
ncbi:hypothetical protein NEAUS07_1545 [Nematocida ausubeli]|nr:hypothetical protein NEAUS07_1545 [Nematocida ausubeli]